MCGKSLVREGPVTESFNDVISIPNLTQALVDNLIILNIESATDEDASDENESGM